MATDKVVIDIVAKDDTKKGIKKAESSFKGLAKTLGPLIAAGFGVAAVKTVTDAYVRQEDAIAQLDARLKSTGNTVGFTSKQLQNFASELQGVTKFGDEAVIEMQSLLLTFTKIGGETFNQATEAILNVSTAMGQDLQSAAIQVGKALNDPILGVTALQRSGIQFTESQKDMIKTLVKSGDTIGAQTIILKELETQFGGAARAAKDTLGGSLQSAENDVGDLAESIGGILAPTIAEFADLASFAARALREMIDPTLKGDIEDINQELQAMDGLLDSLIGEGVAENQIAFVEGQIDDLLAKRLELEQQLAAINEPTATRGAATTTAGVPGVGTQAVQDTALDALMVQLENDQKIRDLEIEQLDIHNQRKIELYDADVAAKISADNIKRESERALVSDLVGLFGVLGSESKAWAIAGIALSKAVAIADIIASTQAASAAALAPPPLGLGPIAGAGLAAGVQASGAARIAIVAATGALQIGQTLSSGPSVNTSPSTQPVAQPQNASTVGQLSGGDNIEVRTGSVLGVFIDEQLIPAMNEANRRGVKLIVT